MRFLCVGYGSIGQRHSEILHALGHQVESVDPNIYVGADWRSIDDVDSWPWPECDGVLDCTPADVRAGWYYPARVRFIEKPLGRYSPAYGKPPTMLGFCYYWLPSLRRFLDSLAVTRIYAVQIVGGQWLPDWHPDADYRERYHGTPGRGGVVLDSLPHSLFIARWILGDVRVVGAVTGKFSGLDIRTEDVAAVLLCATVTGRPCYLQASYLTRPREFYIKADTSDGVWRWDFDPAEADEMYRKQMLMFCEIASGKRAYGFPDLSEGVAVQRLLDEIGGRSNEQTGAVQGARDRGEGG